MVRIINLFFILFIFSSCSSDKEKLIGTWELIETNAARNCEPDYFIFSPDSVTSIRNKCLITERGVYSIVGNEIKINFSNGNKIQSTIEFVNHNLLIKTKIQKELIISKYHPVQSTPQLLTQRNVRCNKDLFICFENCIWKYSGKSYKSKNLPQDFISNDKFTLPAIIDLRRNINPSFNYDACIISNAIPNSRLSFLIENYTGNELHLIPRSDPRVTENEEQFHSNTTYIYHRIYP